MKLIEEMSVDMTFLDEKIQVEYKNSGNDTTKVNECQQVSEHKLFR